MQTDNTDQSVVVWHGVADVLHGPNGPLHVHYGDVAESVATRFGLPSAIDGELIKYTIISYASRATRFLKAELKCHAADHANCFRSRVVGPSETSQFGALEVVGYLGAWMVKDSAYSDRACHIFSKSAKP